ncbi:MULTISPECIES: transporter [Thalassolituus]|jgi:hypothetical protein|uniref:transporter n=1 Tax=Thalassolituus TaxID=187492 RepID=UPI0009492A33|nr:transporter [Thalassolituus oleivorans]APR67569.1 hypothetical protein CN03_11900 [Thalassolituus oleivorans]
MSEQCAVLRRIQSDLSLIFKWSVIALSLFLIGAPAQAAVYVTSGIMYTEWDDTAGSSELAVPVRVRKTGSNYSVSAGSYWLEADEYSGVGDLMVAASLYDIFYAPSVNVGMNLQGSIKFPTASDDIGTGESDQQVGFSLYHLRDNITWYGSGDYRFNGDNNDFEYPDTLLLSFGFIARPKENISLGIFYDIEQDQSVSSSVDTQLFLFVGAKLTKLITLRPFTSISLSSSDTSEFSAGVFIDVQMSSQ